MPGSIDKHAWGKTLDGQTAHLHTLTNRSGMTMRVTTCACIIVALSAPDRVA